MYIIYALFQVYFLYYGYNNSILFLRNQDKVIITKLKVK
jgi:uncharacterized protein YfaA (DUF2138 family)